MPVYWLGLMLIIVFAVYLNWLPAAGADEPGSAILPSLTLASFSMALVARMTRASMLEVLGQDYVRTARAKGLAAWQVVYRHALRNACIPIITAMGLQFGALLGGAVLTETVFGWPGMGQLLVDSIFARDYPMVQGSGTELLGAIYSDELSGRSLVCRYRPPHPLRLTNGAEASRRHACNA
jgi:ABC-type dipeptide/oligopeptide/nickel transport system permease component